MILTSEPGHVSLVGVSFTTPTYIDHCDPYARESLSHTARERPDGHGIPSVSGVKGDAHTWPFEVFPSHPSEISCHIIVASGHFTAR